MTKETRMPNDERSLVTKRAFDLEERSARFGESVIQFCRGLPRNPITDPLIRQVVKSSTSIGANYGEADDAIYKKEFRKNIGTCKKESRETKHWLRMIAAAEPARADVARPLWKEANELLLIFATIFRKVSTNEKKNNHR